MNALKRQDEAEEVIYTIQITKQKRNALFLFGVPAMIVGWTVFLALYGMGMWDVFTHFMGMDQAIAGFLLFISSLGMTIFCVISVAHKLSCNQWPWEH